MQGLTQEVCEVCQEMKWPQATSSTPPMENTDQRWSESQDLRKCGPGAMGGHQPGTQSGLLTPAHSKAVGSFWSSQSPSMRKTSSSAGNKGPLAYPSCCN